MKLATSKVQYSKTWVQTQDDDSNDYRKWKERSNLIFEE